MNNSTLLLVFLTAMFLTVAAQESVPVANSELTNTKLPAHASRVTDGNVPAEVDLR